MRFCLLLGLGVGYSKFALLLDRGGLSRVGPFVQYCMTHSSWHMSLLILDHQLTSIFFSFYFLLW